MNKEIEYIDCTMCVGGPFVGRMPGVGTGAVLRGERITAKVSLAHTATGMAISSAYLGDMERGNRAWSNRRVEQFRSVVKVLAGEQPMRDKSVSW